MRNEDDVVSGLCYLSNECFFMKNSLRVKTEGDYLSPPSHIKDIAIFRFLRLRLVLDKTGLKRSLVHTYKKTGDFPQSLKSGMA